MNIEILSLKNFQNYKDEQISFNKGISLIYGPNGSGKSTLLRAVFAGLFQTNMKKHATKNYNIENLIKTGETDASVELTFSVNSDTYTLYWSITRKKDGSGMTDECYVEQNNSIVESGVRNVGKYIEDILGIDAKAFVNSVYVQQSEISKLLSADTSERKEIFDGLLGLRNIDTYIERAKLAKRGVKAHRKTVKTTRDELVKQKNEFDSKESLKREVEEKTETVSKLESKKEKIEETINSLEDRLDDHTELIDQKQSLQSDLEKQKTKLNSAESDKSQLQDKLSTIQSEKSDLESKIHNLESKIQGLISEISEITHTEVSHIDVTDIKEKIQQTSDKLTELETDARQKSNKLSKVEERYSSNQELIRETQTKIKDFNTKVSDVLVEIENLEAQKESLKVEKQSLLSQINSDVSKLQQQAPNDLSESVTDIGHSKISAEKRTKKINSVLTKYKSKKQNTENNISSLKSTIEQLSNQISDVSESLAELADQSVLRLQASFWNPRIDSDDLTIQSTQKSVEDIYREINAVNDTASKSELDSLTHILYSALLNQNQSQQVELEQRKESLIKSKKSKEEELQIEESQKSEYVELVDQIKEITQAVESYNNTASNYSTVTDQLQEAQSTQNELLSKIHGAAIELKSYKLEQEEYFEKITQLYSQIDQLDSKKDSLSSTKNNLDQLKDLLNSLESKSKQQTSYEEQSNQISSQLSDKITEINTIQARIDKIQDSIAEIETEVTVDKDTIKKKITILSDKKQEISSQIDSVQSKINKCEFTIDSIEKKEDKIKAHDARIGNLSSYITELDDLTERYKQIKKDQRSSAIKFLNKYLQEIFVSIYSNSQYTRIEMTTDYNIKLHTKSGDTIDPEFSSGGEGAIINIALRAAIYRVVTEKRDNSEVGLPPFILDEPTTFLDTTHMEKLSELVQALRDWNVEQVFIVSHQQELIDSADTAYEVSTQPDGSSKVRPQ